MINKFENWIWIIIYDATYSVKINRTISHTIDLKITQLVGFICSASQLSVRKKYVIATFELGSIRGISHNDPDALQDHCVLQ